jgi:antirestriction protein ArdC
MMTGTPAMADLVDEEEGFASVAAEILQAVDKGAGGDWRMPWHAISSRPMNAFSGRPFKGSNLPVLWAAAKRHGFSAHLWAAPKAWARKGGRLKAGHEGTLILVPVFDESGPAETWTPGQRGIEKKVGALGGDAQGGEMRRFLGYRREKWFNVDQVDGIKVAPPEIPGPDEAAERVERVLAAWRRNTTGKGGRRGPALVQGALRACWQQDADRITMPPKESFGSFDGIPGRAFYAGVLAHEHVHATGSPGRLARNMKGKFGSPAYAKEELVAELGSAFLGSLFGLPTALRRDHACYVAGWLETIGDRNRRKSFFWAVKEAEKACDYIIEACGIPEAEIGFLRPSCCSDRGDG